MTEKAQVGLVCLSRTCMTEKTQVGLVCQRKPKQDLYDRESPGRTCMPK